MLRSYLVGGLAALCAGAPLDAQSDSTTAWPIGSRVRVWTASNRKVIGELTEVRGDTLIIRTGSGLIRPRTRMPTSAAVRLDVSRDRYVSVQRVVAGTFLGAIAGVGLTAILAATLDDICILEECSSRDVDYGRAAAIGAVGGAVGGAMTRVDRWEEARTPVRLGIGGDGRHARVVISVSFR